MMWKFGIKSAILGSAIYYTVDKGVWKDSESTATLYKELDEGLSPYVNELKSYSPVELPSLPPNDRVSYLLKYYWNRGVKSTFKFLVDLPEQAADSAVSLYDKIATGLGDAASSNETTK